MIKKLTIFIILFFGLYNLTFAANKVFDNKTNKNNPLNIVSKEVKLIKDKQEIIFIKNVKATQDKFILYADKMTVKYEEDNTGKLQIKSIKTEKDVKFISDTTTAIGDIGYYDLNKNTITLSNNVKATQNGINIEAEKFEYFVETGKSNITGNKSEKTKERVTVILDNQ